jgi:2-iminobutanoate/2-iminopropanoate deaminase
MKRAIITGMHEDDSPIEWAVQAGNTMFTAQIPIHADGRIETGSANDQAKLTFSNLAKTVEAAGGTMDDVTQVIVYLTTKEAFAPMNDAFTAAFRAPYPNRATVIVAGLMVEGACIEITAQAHIEA